MRNIIVIMLFLFAGFSTNQLYAQKKGNKIVCFKSNMDCVKCEKKLGEYLKFEKGVKSLELDHSSNTILIEYKEGKNTDKKIAEAIVKKGYKADQISKKEYKKLNETVTQHNHDHGK